MKQHISLLVSNTGSSKKSVTLFDKNKIEKQNITIEATDFDDKKYDKKIIEYNELLDNFLSKDDKGYIIGKVFAQMISGSASQLFGIPLQAVYPEINSNIQTISYTAHLSPYQFQTSTIETKIKFALFKGVSFEIIMPPQSSILFLFVVSKEITGTPSQMIEAAEKFELPVDGGSYEALEKKIDTLTDLVKQLLEKQ